MKHRMFLALPLLLLPLLLLLPPAPNPVVAQARNQRQPAPPEGGDWPLFRGNALQTGVTSAKLPERLEVLWKFQTKEGIEAAAAIVGDTVYVGSLDEHLYALDLRTGAQKWKYKGTGGFKAPPSVSEGLVFVGDEEGLFHCVDAATGQKRWTFETGAEITSGANFAGKFILFGSHDSTLYCLDRAGKLVWKFKTQGPVNGSPVVAGNQTFVAGCDSNLHAIDVTTGKELAEIELSGQAAATAGVVGDRLYVGNMGNQVQAARPEKEGNPVELRAGQTSPGVLLVGSRDGQTGDRRRPRQAGSRPEPR